jgi:rhamnose utilization protein RhaD (predicted bifunctional aldolase and dehydrogenase)
MFDSSIYEIETNSGTLRINRLKYNAAVGTPCHSMYLYDVIRRRRIIYSQTRQHMDHLSRLVEISRFYGSNPDYVIAGGGNTSYKNDSELYIKASGISLASITAEGFVKMSREKLNQIGEAVFPEDPAEREQAVKVALGKAVISPENLRPSVETSLHNLIDYPYIVHTHPTLVNAVMCANDAREVVEERFGQDALYMEYTDPGYILFKKLEGLIREYEHSHHRAPRIIFLQNHGVFVGGGTIDEIKSVYHSIESRINEGNELSLPASEPLERSSGIVREVVEFMNGLNYKVRSFRSPLIDHFTASSDQFKLISRPFSPDIIVYCKSNYLFLEENLERERIYEELNAFERSYGYLPKVMIEEKGGLIIAEENEKSIQTVLEVYVDLMKISYLSEKFGGPHFMTEAQIAFIDSWEVENYRRSIARKQPS